VATRRPRKSEPDAERASGKTQAEEVTEEVSAEADASIEATLDDGPHLPEDQPERAQETKRPRFRTPGFSRMRTSWRPDDQAMMVTIHAAIEDRIMENFGDAYIVMNDLFEIVRRPEVDANGEVVRDRHGFAVWVRKPNGAWDEDWTRLTRADKENFLFEITTRIFAWETFAANAWAESMFAKGQWEERHAIAYAAPVDGTIEDRTAYAKADAAEERYFAIFLASYSRRADGITKTMSLLAQRLKDTLDA
jgi:hypothetical protein